MRSPALPVLRWTVRRSPRASQGTHSNPEGAETPLEDLLPPAPQIIYLTTSNSSLVNSSRGDQNSGCKARDSFSHSWGLAPMQVFVLHWFHWFQNTIKNLNVLSRNYCRQGKGPAYMHRVFLGLISRTRKLHLYFCIMQSDRNNNCGEEANKRTAVNNNLANTVLQRIISHSP